MQKIPLLLIFLLACNSFMMAQTYSVEGFVTTGNVLEKDYSAGKSNFGICGYYHFSDHTQIGLEVGTGGTLFPVDSRDFRNDTTYLNAASFNFNTMLLKARYYFAENFLNGRLYTGLSSGYAKFFRWRSFDDRTQSANRTMIAVPELGFTLDRVNLSIQYYLPFDTPGYSDTVNNRTTHLEASRFSMILLRFGYQYPFNRSKKVEG